jgi:hypothetical protein
MLNDSWTGQNPTRFVVPVEEEYNFLPTDNIGVYKN